MDFVTDICTFVTAGIVAEWNNEQQVELRLEKLFAAMDGGAEKGCCETLKK